MSKYFSRSGYFILILGLVFLSPFRGLSQQADSTSIDSSAAISVSNDSTSFFRISAIKTVSGIKPDDEFFDIHLNWTWSENWFTVGSFDIALTNTGTDSVSTSSQEFTEAGFFLNCVVKKSKDKRRQAFVGLGLKQFDTITYFGGQIGAIELKASAFSGSYFTAGLLRRLYGVDSTANAMAEVKEHRWNLYLEFGIHSDKAPFLNALRIKAGILIPLPGLNDNPDPVNSDLKSRIVIEVPLRRGIWF